MPTELELIALKTEFDLYLPFTKRLVLNLPSAEDRTRAAQWLQRMRAIRDDNQLKLRNEHLKLLLFALHRRSLVGVFGVKPPDGELESFHDGLTLLEMTRELIEITEKEKVALNSESKESPLPTVLTNLSFDMKEYCAGQMIPKFGSHCYYAISKEPIQFWKKSGFGSYPEMNDYPNTHLWEVAIAKISDGVLETQAAIDKAIENAKKIESGELSPDDVEPQIDFNKKIDVPKCQASSVFKWKKDSLLNLYLEVDPVGNGDFNDLIGQGKIQLEVDEEAFEVLDTSLPGRRRVVVRDPFFNDVPADLSERRVHGVVDAVIHEEENDEVKYGQTVCPNLTESPCECIHDPTCQEDIYSTTEEFQENTNLCPEVTYEDPCSCSYQEPQNDDDCSQYYGDQYDDQRTETTTPYSDDMYSCQNNSQYYQQPQRGMDYQQYEEQAWAANQMGGGCNCEDNFMDTNGYEPPQPRMSQNSCGCGGNGSNGMGRVQSRRR